MAVNAKRLKSGSYRALVYHYTDLNGKRHYKSFTDKNKKECEKKACEFVANSKDNGINWNNNINLYDITVKRAVNDYITIKESVLSPTTICGYKKAQNKIKPLNDYSISELNSVIVQRWISSLASELSPKTIRNVYGVFNSAIKMYNLDFRINVTLPQKEKPKLYTPDNNDVKSLISACEGTYLELAILLAVFGPMRRGEIAALTYADIIDNKIIINKAYAQDYHNKWVLKAPKTLGSNRIIEYPDRVINKIWKLYKQNNKNLQDEVIPYSANCITERFCNLRDKVGLKHIRFHDLRHYSASILHAIGIPDKYIMQRGGWQSDYTMKRVYQETIDQETRTINKKINTYFDNF